MGRRCGPGLIDPPPPPINQSNATASSQNFIKNRKFVNSALNLCATPPRPLPTPTTHQCSKERSKAARVRLQSMNDVRTRMRGGKQCGRGEKREEREVCAGQRSMAALQTVLLCCGVTGNPSLDQVFLSPSLSFLSYPLSLSVTRYCELKGTKGHYTRIQGVP